MHTAEPVATFIMRIPVSVIPSKDTSIDRCNEKIETKAFTKEIFRKATIFADLLFRACIHLMIAREILVNVYVAIASIAINGNTVPLSFTKESMTVPTREMDSTINIAPVNRRRNFFLPLCRKTAKRMMLNMA